MNSSLRLLAEGTSESSPLLNLILDIIPWVIVVLVVWWFLKRLTKKNAVANAESVARGKSYMDANRAHWAAVEAKLDRMIALLEERK